ncbi:MAG: 5'/3'-nucleotidase SurE, partial [Oscillospiraceae bacterium]|nr:5'/3'-nucleotidase SurE [Oscillospiraceae bacterium]
MHSILITNDDGILSNGLIRLVKAAQAFGKVYVAAPDGQRSAASHAITLHGTIDVYPHAFPVPGVRAFSVSGTPADCIRVGCLSIMPHLPDTVLSGINHGYNVATDLQYSGTVGAAFEGAFQGVRSIALSEAAQDTCPVTDAFLPEILAELLEAETVPGEIINVNFPGCPLSRFRGIRRDCIVSHGAIYHDRYKVTELLPDGGKRLIVDG